MTHRLTIIFCIPDGRGFTLGVVGLVLRAARLACIDAGPAQQCAVRGLSHHLVVPVTYSVDHRRQRVHAVASGDLILADLSSYITARVKDGVYDYDQLIDLTEATMDVGSHEVLNLVRQARVNLAAKPIPFTAIVARPGSATYGLARQLATLFDFDGASVHIADTFEAARDWLDQMRSGERHAKQR